MSYKNGGNDFELGILGWEDIWLGKRLMQTQRSVSIFSMGLLAKEVTFGTGNLDSVSSNPQHSTSDQKVTVSLMKLFQGP